MDRKMKAGSLRLLGDEELTAVSGGHHHRHHRHPCHRQTGGEVAPRGSASGAAGGDLLAMLETLLQSNTAAIFQFVVGNGNTVTANVAQGNLA